MCAKIRIVLICKVSFRFYKVSFLFYYSIKMILYSLNMAKITSNQRVLIKTFYDTQIIFKKKLKGY